MTGHILPESTNACPTSPTTDIQPELPETQLGRVIGACSEDDGVPDIGVSIGLGEGSMLWLGELLKRDGADIGFVFHGPDGKRIVAPIWPSCEWQDVADLLRHHVAPILARLTSTTPTLGGMVMVPREPTEAMLTRGVWELTDGEPNRDDLADAYRAMLSAAPASPIPISVANEGEDWTGGRAWPEMLEAIASYWAEWEEDRAGTGTYLPEELAQDAGEFATGLADHLAALSPALDNTAVEEAAKPTWRVVGHDSTLGPYVVVDGVPRDQVVLCYWRNQIQPIHLRLPGQAYVDGLIRLMDEHQCNEVAIIPVRHTERVSITRAALSTVQTEKA